MAAVNRPTDTQQKEKDVNNKLQLYGIYSAFANGKVPSNKQIDIALNSALASKGLQPSKRLSAEGQGLVQDLRNVVKQAQHLLLSKNEGNLLQDFIWDSQHLEGQNATLPSAPTDKETAKQHGNEAKDGLKTLATLMLSNGQFRKLLSDATVLFRDMAGDAAQKAANKVNPSEDQLRQIDEPAEENTWHDVPDLSRDNLKSSVKSTYDRNKPFSAEEAKQAAREGADTAQNHPAQGQDNQQAARAGANNAAANLRAKASQNIPEERKEDARNAKQAAVTNTKNYMKEKIPEERRDQTIWRLKKMIVEIQGHSDYQDAIETLLSLAETYGGHTKTVALDAKGTAKDTHGDNAGAINKFRTLIERFANSTSTDDLFEALDNIYRDADQDPELKKWFRSMDRFIRRCLQEQGYILRDEATNEYKQLEDQGRFLLRERYRDHTDRILDEFKFLGDQFDKDPQNQAFGQAMQKLFNDLGQDENGQPAFKPHLIKDLTEVIIPGIFENTRYVPIPRIEVSDPMFDAIVENLVIESDNLFPNTMEFGSDNYYRMGRRQVSSKWSNTTMISASGIQMDLRDVAYYVKRKQGFPSITDKGVMDIILAGEGFSFKIAARNAQKSDRTHFLVLDKIDVTIHSLAIKIKQSNHKLLFTIAKSLLLKIMKPIITKVIEQQIKANFEKGDAYLYGIHQEAQKAAERAKKDPENAPAMYQNYVTAIQNRIQKKKEQAKDKASKTDVNIAVTKQDSMFKHISLPGGISTKATQYKDLAAQGNRWESPIFGIGSARESSDIPRLAPVKRKPHSTAAGEIRGGNHPSVSSAAGTTASGTTVGGNNYGTGYGSGAPGSGYGSGNTGGGYGAGAGALGAGAGAGALGAGAAAGYGAGAHGSGTTGSGYGAGAPGSGYNSGATGAGYGTGAAGGIGGIGSNTQSRADPSGRTSLDTYATGEPIGRRSLDTYATGEPIGNTSGFSNQVDRAFDSGRGAGSGVTGTSGAGTNTGSSPGVPGQGFYHDSVTQK